MICVNRCYMCEPGVALKCLIFVARYYFCFATEDRMLAGQIVGADISVNNRLKVCGSWHMQYCIRILYTYQVSSII